MSVSNEASPQPQAGDRVDYSVAIPGYGDPALLAGTLRAALAQEWPAEMRWEIVVNDDGSDPPLSDALGEFRGRVRFERNSERVGWPENWNRTLQKSHGTWVHLLHTDDLVLPDFAATMWNLAQQFPKAAYIHSALRSRVLRQPLLGRLYNRLRGGESAANNTGTAKVYRAGAEAARHALVQGVRIVTIVVRREAALSIDGFREELWSMSDEEYVVRLARVGDVVYCPKAMCLYTYHSAQLSHSSSLEPNYVARYLRVQEEGLKALGADATDADRDAMHWRVACVACGAARARAMAGDLPAAREALDAAARLAPRIATTRLYKVSRLIAANRLARFAYRRLVGG